MAVSTESSNKVWQKVKAALNSAGVKRSGGASAEMFAALKMYLATQKKNPDLQFIPITAADIDTGSNGLVSISGAGRFYAAWFKRVADVDTTDSFIEVLDDATDNSNAAADSIVTLRLNGTDDLAGEEVFAIYPEGHAFATGIVVTAVTASAGVTESAATESADGFVIVGAA